MSYSGGCLSLQSGMHDSQHPTRASGKVETSCAAPPHITAGTWEIPWGCMDAGSPSFSQHHWHLALYQEHR
jgi:hypothetical protein